MALPANPASPSTPFQSPTDWFAEHTQRNHRNSPHGQKRRIDDDAADTPSAISHGFKKLRVSPPRRQKRPEYTHSNSSDLHYTYERTSSPTSAYQPPAVTNDHDHDFLDAPFHEEPAVHPGLHNDSLQHAQLHHYRSQLFPAEGTCDTPPPQRLPSNHEDFMPVEDNRHRIFISDLDAAIAEIEAEEREAKEKAQERAFFLPDDVDKELSSIPDEVLRSSMDSSASNPPVSQALVLYRDPLSISIPEEVDAVRKAMVEARQRIRERPANQAEERLSGSGHAMSADPNSFGYPLDRQQSDWRQSTEPSSTSDYDCDTMDIDIE
jgi:hypothetical protein